MTTIDAPGVSRGRIEVRGRFAARCKDAPLLIAHYLGATSLKLAPGFWQVPIDASKRAET